MELEPWTEGTTDALDLLEDVTARARHMKLGLVAYPVDEVERICAALRAVRNIGPQSLSEKGGQE